MGRLYIVATPIGNLGDMSHRALDVLREADRILAEDTRRSSILLRHYGIETPLVSVHAHNEAARTVQALDWLRAGETLALISDAGTPLLSDPGSRLVQAVIGADVEVVPIPGASAILAALVASGLDPEPFTFYGFLPRTGSARMERVREVCALRHTVVLYESPNRLVRLLEDLAEACGPERWVAVGRELTKRFESFYRGTLRDAAAYYREAGVRGEVVVVLAGRAEVAEDDQALEARARALVAELLEAGGRPSAVSREVARRLGLPKNRVYEIALEQSDG